VRLKYLVLSLQSSPSLSALLRPTLKTLDVEAGVLQGVIGRASQLADSVSCKVRLLDQAKSRVYDCMKRVDDVIDLKSCVDGVQYAMTTGDYEKAAAHIHRYLALDENILLETTADSVKGRSKAGGDVWSVTVLKTLNVL
jgi:hypothetical protein